MTTHNAVRDGVGLTCRFILLEKGPLARAEAAVAAVVVAALPLRSCSLWNSRSSRRCVSASFCWMAMRSNEFSVFFSSSAAASCLCMSSSWITYSSHLQTQLQRERESERRSLQTIRAPSLPFPAHGLRQEAWPKSGRFRVIHVTIQFTVGSDIIQTDTFFLVLFYKLSRVQIIWCY